MSVAIVTKVSLKRQRENCVRMDDDTIYDGKRVRVCVYGLATAHVQYIIAHEARTPVII